MNKHHEHDDVDFEPEEELGDVAAAQAKLKKLRDELKEAQAKRDEYLAGWQREKADAINARKDALAQGERRAERALESFVEELLPVLDSFDLATGSEQWLDMDENWRSGIDMIRNQLTDVLARNNVVRFGKVGEMADHTQYEVVQEVDDVAGESGEIVKILRYGYRMHDRVIRPAQVIVKK